MIRGQVDLLGKPLHAAAHAVLARKTTEGDDFPRLSLICGGSKTALADAERLQLAMQRRTFHANKLGRARNIS